MDWSASGISHVWRFELLDAVTHAHKGWLNGVTGGTITESYRGDYRASATLELDSTEVPLGTAVRIWHDASYKDDSVTTMIGTFEPEPFDCNYIHARKSGTLELYSTMKKLDTHLYKGVTSVKKGANVLSHFKSVVTESGAIPYVTPDWKTTATFGGTYLWLRWTESSLSEAHRCADAIGGYVTVDEQGRVVMKPYVLPSKMGASWTLDSIIELGVDIDVPDVVNRVVVGYEENLGNNNTKYYSAMATVDAAHPWSYSRIKRWEVVEISPPTFESGTTGIQAALQKLVNDELASLTTAKDIYSVTTLYRPDVKAGTAGKLVYQDGGDGINAKVFCSEREIRIDSSSEMSLTLERVS